MNEDQILKLACKFARSYFCGRCLASLVIIGWQGDILLGCPQCGNNAPITFNYRLANPQNPENP